MAIRTPSQGTASALKERLSAFAAAKFLDGDGEDSWKVLVPDPSSEGFKLTLAEVAAWLEEEDLQSAEIDCDGDVYVIDRNSHLASRHP